MDDKQSKEIIEPNMVKKLQIYTDIIENRIVWYNSEQIVIW